MFCFLQIFCWKETFPSNHFHPFFCLLQSTRDPAFWFHRNCVGDCWKYFLFFFFLSAPFSCLIRRGMQCGGETAWWKGGKGRGNIVRKSFPSCYRFSFIRVCFEKNFPLTPLKTFFNPSLVADGFCYCFSRFHFRARAFCPAIPLTANNWKMTSSCFSLLFGWAAQASLVGEQCQGF